MKKRIFLVAMLAVALSGFAQKRNVSRAEDKLYEPTESNLRSAQVDIEAAMKDPTTSEEAKTYYVAGKVYYKFYEEEERKCLDAKEKERLGMTVTQRCSQEVKDNYLVKAIDAFAKAALLDELPNEKGKVNLKYSKEIKKNLEQYSQYLIREGINNYSENEFKKAVALWAKYFEMPSYPILKTSGLDKDSTYNQIKYYAVLAARNIPELKQQTIQYMEDLKKARYEELPMFQWLYEEYSAAGDTAKFVKTLQEGLRRFPTDKFMTGNLINYYIYSNKVNEAIAYLDDAIKSDPKNSQYYAVKGNLLLNSKKDYDAAIAEYNKAKDLDPSNALALAGLGLIYVTKAEEISNNANDISDNKKYNAEMQRAKAEFEKALPFLEKARTLKADDVDNLRVLSAAYLRLNRGSDYDRINAEIKALGY